MNNLLTAISPRYFLSGVNPRKAPKTAEKRILCAEKRARKAVSFALGANTFVCRKISYFQYHCVSSAVLS